MSTFASVETTSRASDWFFVLLVLSFSYLLIYPLYILVLRKQRSRRIRKQLVTAEYNLPTVMTPTEFSYIFSTTIKRPQLYSTLLHLANRSILHLRTKEGIALVELGPKIEDNLKSFELMLLTPIQVSDRQIPVSKVLEGNTNYTYNNDKILSGSKNYVYWWLLRQELRDRGVIEKRMTGRYTKMLFIFGAGSGLLISVVSLVSWHFVEMLSRGEVDFGHLISTAYNSLGIWAISVVPLIFISFFLLRFKGKMLGRNWLLTSKYKRYEGQLVSFREFVRLTHKGKLKFESKELEQQSRLDTKPYAIALGYIKE